MTISVHIHRGIVLTMAWLSVACTALLPGSDVVRDGGGSTLADASTSREQPDAGDVHDASQPGDASQVEVLLADAGDASSASACPPEGMRERRLLSNADLTTDSHWNCAFDYEIEGYVVVSAGTLTIEAGTHVFGRAGAFLLVSNAARLVAVGTEGAPIVFSAALRPAKPGAWRGLFLLGRADTALPNNATIGLPVGDPRAMYGGTDDNHDCGALRYVRVEFAGGDTNAYDFPGAALSFLGCGRNTEVDHVQVHAARDGIGLVGGTLPLKHVLVSAPGADGIEWSAGYRGFIQFAIVQTFYGSGAAMKGSQLDADPSSLPLSAPVIFNATVVGADYPGLPTAPRDPNGFETGFQLQAGTEAVIRNSIAYGFPGVWLDIRDAVTVAGTLTNTRISNSIFTDPAVRNHPGLPGMGIEPGDGEDDDQSFSEDAWLRAPALQNRFPTTGLELQDPYARPPARPDFSADGFVDGGNLADAAPRGWEGVWEPAFYAGALPRIQFDADRTRDWTRPATATAADWTSFPKE